MPREEGIVSLLLMSVRALTRIVALIVAVPLIRCPRGLADAVSPAIAHIARHFWNFATALLVLLAISGALHSLRKSPSRSSSPRSPSPCFS
ncbi:MAG: hypothetical protein V2G49_06675 [bacterium JZ-2024 1]